MSWFKTKLRKEIAEVRVEQERVREDHDVTKDVIHAVADTVIDLRSATERLERILHEYDHPEEARP